MDLYLLGRVFGTTAFSLMLVQIILATWFRKYIKWHMTIGKVAFILAWLHPIMFGFAWNLGGYVWLGRIALALLTGAVVAVVLRIRHWRWIHRLNYVVFGLIYIHSWSLGTDARIFPLSIIYWIAPVVVIASLTTKVIASRIASNGYR